MIRWGGGRPLHPQISTWRGLQAWIAKRLSAIEVELKPRDERATLIDLEAAIREAVYNEEDEATRTAYEDAAEAEYKEAYGDDFDKLATWQAEGR